MSMTMLLTIGLSMAVFALYFLAMSVRLIFLKKGEFRGTCATQNPLLKSEMGDCDICGGKPELCETNNTNQSAALPKVG